LVNIVNLIGLGAVVIIGILIFTQFQKLGGFLGSLKFPEIKLPDFNIPSLDATLSELGQVGPLPPTPENVIGDDTSGGFGTRDRGEGQGGLIGPTQDLFGGFIGQLSNFFGQGNNGNFFSGDPRREGVMEAAPSNLLNAGGNINEQKEQELQVQSSFGGQQFFGGGPSFIGGSVIETPIANLSLSQIIDRFGVTASQAADIRARETEDFGDFNFGTNTGGGIGSIIPTISSLLSNFGAVSDSNFQGLSAQEIALRLTGGNISNF